MNIREIASTYTFQSSGWFSMKQPGDYIVRIVSEFFPYLKAPFEHGKDPAQVFLCRVIDRADGKIKLYEMNNAVMKCVLVLASDDEAGFETIPPYDIKIVKMSTGPLPKNVRYSVLNRLVKPLTTEEENEVLALDPISVVGEKFKKREADKMETVIVARNVPITNDEVPPPQEEVPPHSDEDFI